MTTPTLALGVSAPGAQDVIALAQAVANLQGNLAKLQATAGGSGLGNLDKLANQMTRMRREAAVAIQGLRNDLAEGFSKAFGDAKRSVDQGGDTLAEATKKAAAKVKVAAQSIDLGGGIKASVSGSGLQSVENVRKLAGEISQGGEAVAAALKAQQDKIAALRAKGALAMKGPDAARQLLGLPSESDMAAASARIKAQMTEMARIEESVFKATKSASGPWSGLASRNVYGMPKETPKVLEETGNKARKAALDMSLFTSNMNDAHSAARGLASGFGLLWLTWGKLVPLMAGAAVSHSIAKTFEVGSEVSYNIKFMQIMSDTTVEASNIVREELRKINVDTKFTLTELSQAMVNLGQAGKTTPEALKMIKPVADLATVGMTDMKTATDLVIQSQALFGLKAADTDKLVSQLYLTTKSGAVNIEHLGGSMKYASEANTRFGVSIEETLTVLKGLGDAGLKGSSGGTAFINFLRDLHGRSGPAIQAMKDLEKHSGQTIQLYVKEGNVTKMRDMIGIFTDIAKAAGKLKFEDQDRILAKLFSDRGGRAFFSMIRDGTVNLTEFRKQLEQIDPNMAAKAAKELMEKTAKGQFDMLKSNLSNSLDAVFQRFESGFIEILKKLSELVTSSGFQGFISAAVGSVQMLINTLLALKEPLTAVVTAWAGFKVLGAVQLMFAAASAGIATFTGNQLAAGAATNGATLSMTRQGAVAIGLAAEQRALALGVEAQTAAQLRNSAATAASTGAMRGAAVAAGFLANPLVGLVTTIALLGATWYTTSKYAEQGTATITDAVIKNGTINIEQFQKEINKLRERNALMGVKPDIYAGAEDAIAKAKKEELGTLAEINRLRDRSSVLPGRDGDNKYRENLQRAAQLEDKYKVQVASTNAAIKSLYATRAKDAADEEQRQKAAMAKIQGQIGQNPNAPPVTGKERGGAGRVQRAAYDNELKTLESMLATETSMYKDAYDKQRQQLEAKHRGNLIDEGTYQAELIQLTTSYEDAERARILEKGSQWAAAWGQRWDKAKATMKGAALDQELKNLTNEAQKYGTTITSMLTKIDNEAMNRQKMAIISAEAETRKLVEANTDYWTKAEQNSDKEAKLVALRNQLASASEDVRVRREAELKVEEQHVGYIEKLTKEYNDATSELASFMVTMDEAGVQNAETDAAFETLVGKVAALAEALELSAEKVNKLKQAAGDAAVQDLGNKNVEKLRKDAEELGKTVTGKLADAILSGGKGGFKELKEWAKDYFLKTPLKIMLQGVLQPVGNMVANMGLNLLGIGGGISGGVGGGGGMLGSLSNLSSIANFAGGNGFMGNVLGGFMSATGMTGAMTGATVGTAAQLGAGFEAYMGSQGVLASAGGTGAGLGGALAAAGPYLAIAAAIAMIAQATKGEKRSGGQYGYSFDGTSVYNPRRDRMQAAGGIGATFLEGPSGGDPAGEQVKTLINGQVASINSAMAAFGSGLRLTQFQGGYEGSEKGRGGVFSGGTFNNGLAFGESGRGSNYEGTLFEKTSPQKLSTEDAAKNFVTDIYQSYIQALQTAANQIGTEDFEEISETLVRGGEDFEEMVKTVLKGTRTTFKTIEEESTEVPKVIRDMLRGIDAEALSNDAAKALYDQISAVIMSVQGLRTAVAQMPMTQLRNMSFDAAAGLIKFAGSLETLTANLQTYYQNFYTAAEQRTASSSNIASTLQGAGINISADLVSKMSRQQFRSLVEAVDVSTEAGQKMYATLMSVAGAFAQITPAADDGKQQLETTISTLETTIERFGDFAKRIREFRDSLLLGSLSPLTPGEKYAEAARQFQSTYTKAMGGDQDAMDKLQSAAEEYLKASQVYNASGSQYLADFAEVQAALTSVASKAESSVTIARSQLEIARSQLSSLETINNTVASGDAAVVAAIEALVGSISAVSSGNGYNAATAGDAVKSLYKELFNRTPDQEGYDYWTQRLVGGESLESLRAAMKASGDYVLSQQPQGYANGGYATGSAMVGERGREFVDFVTPGRVYNATETAGMFSANPAQLAELRALRREIAQLREERNQATRAQIAAMIEAEKQNAQAVVEGTNSSRNRDNYERRMAKEATLD